MCSALSRPELQQLPCRQRGATLLVALTVVMVVGILATSVSHDFLVQSRRVENQLEAEQVGAYLVGAESVARQALLVDLQSEKDWDYAGEPWARTLELELPVGTLKACMIDLQGRINLNSLASPAGEGYSSDQRRFIRLLQALDLESPLDQTAATMLANAVFDWVDPDNDQRFPGGAEDLTYYRETPAGKAANQPFASVSELLLVSGMTREIYRALTPHVTLWGNGQLNVNSADARLTREKLQGEFTGNDTPPPVVLRTLNAEDQLTPLSEDAAWQLVNQRIDAGGFHELEDLGQGRLTNARLELDGVGLASDYFSMVSELVVDERVYQVQSVLYRYVDALGIPNARVVSRRRPGDHIMMDEYCVN